MNSLCCGSSESFFLSSYQPERSNYEAWINGRLVRTFSHLDMAERYKRNLEACGAEVEIKRRSIPIPHSV